MSDGSANVSRRRFLQATTGAAAASAATGTAAAQEGNETGGGGNESGGGGNETGGGGAGGDAPPPDYEGWFSNTDNYDGTTEDLRGQETATGPNAFGPPAIHVDPGTTVQFEWTGDGFHNVVEENENWSSGDAVGEAGVHYERTFEEEGIQKYICVPHESNGMFGAVVVGSDYPSVDTGGGNAGPALPDAAKSMGVAASVVMAATLGLAYVFIRHGGRRREQE